jgi:hypothetical protein
VRSVRRRCGDRHPQTPPLPESPPESRDLNLRYGFYRERLP